MYKLVDEESLKNKKLSYKSEDIRYHTYDTH